MPLAAIMGYGPTELVDLGGFKPKAEPGNIVIVGARDLDAQERRIVKKSGIHVFTMRDIDERGLRAVMEELLLETMFDLPSHGPGSRYLIDESAVVEGRPHRLPERTAA